MMSCTAPADGAVVKAMCMKASLQKERGTASASSWLRMAKFMRCVKIDTDTDTNTDRHRHRYRRRRRHRHRQRRRHRHRHRHRHVFEFMGDVYTHTYTHIRIPKCVRHTCTGRLGPSNIYYTHLLHTFKYLLHTFTTHAQGDWDRNLPHGFGVYTMPSGEV